MITWDGHRFELALQQAAQGVLRAREVCLTADQLDRLLAAVPRHPDRSYEPMVTLADFRGAQFDGDANFEDVVFSGLAGFTEVTFGGAAKFDRATFSDLAFFDAATFTGPTGFEFTTFERQTSFMNSTFLASTTFQHARLNGKSSYAGARFGAMVIFSNAKFHDDADFQKISSSGDSGFATTIFEAAVSFDGATLEGDVNFGAAQFGSDVTFRAATFGRGGSFGAARFGGAAIFDLATFIGNVSFSGGTFPGVAGFTGATFHASPAFNRVTFRENAHFFGATFRQSAGFNNVTSEKSLDLGNATFEMETAIGPIHVHDTLWLDGAVFAGPVTIEASALGVSLARTKFRDRADVRLRWAEMWLEDTEFAEETLLRALRPRVTIEGSRDFLGWELPEDGETWSHSQGEPPEGFEPRLLSVRGANLTGLKVSGVDLGLCLFADANGIDSVRMDNVRFARPPAGWRRISWLPMRWTVRRTIAEEHQWRVGAGHGSDWLPVSSQRIYAPPTRLGARGLSPWSRAWPQRDTDPLPPDRIAMIYRELRKAREDNRDEPGANDFYYGEMEMRRRRGPLAERAILWLYWLVSGYGLRASRALLALSLTIVLLGAIPLALWGFNPDRTYGQSILFALQSSISLLRAPPTLPAQETAAGQVIEIFLRLAGPLFFGLALLALRGRVKR